MCITLLAVVTVECFGNLRQRDDPSGEPHGSLKAKGRLRRVKRIIVVERDVDFLCLLGEIANARRYASYLISE